MINELDWRVPDDLLTRLERDLQIDLASIRVLLDVAEVFQNLRQTGMLVAVCSNLAEPYGAPMLQALP